jgi:ParB/RepB/Spo0J family partition protein
MPYTKLIALAEIDPPEIAMRVAMDDHKLEGLRLSMRDTGLIHPLCVVEDDGRYRIEDGHRRYVCAKDLGWFEVRCEVYNPAEIASGAVMVAANIYREDPSAAEEALLFAEHRAKYNLDEAGLCARFHVSADYLADRFRLLRGDRRIFDAVLARRINFSVGRELNKCPDEAHRGYLLDVAMSTGYSAAVMADHVRQWRANQTPTPAAQGIVGDCEPPAPPAEYTVECVLCGGHRDPWNMVSVMIHKHELDMIQEQLKRAAQDVG